MEIYNYIGAIFIYLNFNCNLILKYLIWLTLSNVPVDLLFVLKYSSFTFTIHLHSSNTRL